MFRKKSLSVLSKVFIVSAIWSIFNVAHAWSGQSGSEGWKSLLDCDNLLFRVVYKSKLDKDMYLWSVEFRNNYMWDVRFSWGLGSRESNHPVSWSRNDIASGGTFKGSEHLQSAEGPIKVYVRNVLVSVPSDDPAAPTLFKIDYCPCSWDYPHISERNKYPAKKKEPPESAYPPDQSKVNYYWKSCNDGNQNSCINLAKAYEEANLGLVKNADEAWKYYDLACNFGNDSACDILGRGKEHYLASHTGSHKPVVRKQVQRQREQLSFNQHAPQGLSPHSLEYRKIENSINLACDAEGDLVAVIEFINIQAPINGHPCVNKYGLANKMGKGFRQALFGYRAKGCALALETATNAGATNLVQSHTQALDDFLGKAGLSNQQQALKWECPDAPKEPCNW